MNPRNPEEHSGSDPADDSRPSLYDPTPLVIGRRLSGEEVWATITVTDDQLLLTHVAANRPGRARN
jgi:hypothetical protein